MSISIDVKIYKYLEYFKDNIFDTLIKFEEYNKNNPINSLSQTSIIRFEIYLKLISLLFDKIFDFIISKIYKKNISKKSYHSSKKNNKNYFPIDLNILNQYDYLDPKIKTIIREIHTTNLFNQMYKIAQFTHSSNNYEYKYKQISNDYYHQIIRNDKIIYSCSSNQLIQLREKCTLLLKFILDKTIVSEKIIIKIPNVILDKNIDNFENDLTNDIMKIENIINFNFIKTTNIKFKSDFNYIIAFNEYILRIMRITNNVPLLSPFLDFPILNTTFTNGDQIITQNFQIKSQISFGNNYKYNIYINPNKWRVEITLKLIILLINKIYDFVLCKIFEYRKKYKEHLKYNLYYISKIKDINIRNYFNILIERKKIINDCSKIIHLGEIQYTTTEINKNDENKFKTCCIFNNLVQEQSFGFLDKNDKLHEKIGYNIYKYEYNVFIINNKNKKFVRIDNHVYAIIYFIQKLLIYIENKYIN